MKLESHSKISSLLSNQLVMEDQKLLNLCEAHCGNSFRELSRESASVPDFGAGQ
jgi:hypothetical protein